MVLSRVTRVLGGSSGVALAAEAVDLLEAEESGPALVGAYAELAGQHYLAGAFDDTITAAKSAVMIAERLGLPVPARALGFWGVARVYVGDAEGLAEMERALTLLLEQGAGRDAAVLQNNLAVARYPLEGPEEALAACEQGISFCEQRGLGGMAAELEGNCPGLLAELGRPREALARAGPLDAALEESGDTIALSEVRSAELAIRLAFGECEETVAWADWLVEAVRASGAAEYVVLALAVAAASRLAPQPEEARALLIELEQTPGARETVYYSRQLPAMLRTALAAGEPELANRLADALEPRYPLDKHALCAARAQLAEHAGDHAEAATLYAEATEGWQKFGNVPENAHALLGQGRCLLALGDPAFEQPLRQAAELFRSMGYRPALAETEALIDQTVPAS